MSLSLKSSLVARLGAFYQRGNGRSTDQSVFFQPHFDRRSGFGGPADNIGRFFFSVLWDGPAMIRQPLFETLGFIYRRYSHHFFYVG